jgi:hypothetical protein
MRLWPRRKTSYVPTTDYFNGWRDGYDIGLAVRLARVSNDHGFVALIMMLGFAGWWPGPAACPACRVERCPEKVYYP